jgi:two-component system cell cycle sensor histidine kinase/response regulator CckA
LLRRSRAELGAVLRRGRRAFSPPPRGHRVVLVTAALAAPALVTALNVWVPYFDRLPGVLYVAAFGLVTYFCGALLGLVAVAESFVLADAFVHVSTSVTLPSSGVALAMGVVVVLIIASVVDREREARREAEENEERFRSLVHEAPGIVWESSLTGPPFFVSEQIRTVLGYPPERWQEPGFTARATHPDDYETLRAARETLLDEGSLWREYRMRHADGRWIWLRDLCGVVRDAGGEPVGIRGISIDVTEEKHAQARLAASELRFRRVFEAAQLGLVVIDAETRQIESANPAFCAIAGFSEEELLGRTPMELTEGDEPLIFGTDLMRRLVAGEVASVSSHAVMIRPGGGRVHVDIVATLVEGADGKQRVVGMAEDRTESVLAAHELARKERHFRGLFESAAVGIGLADPSGRIVEVNEALASMLGYTPAEVEGMNIRDLTAPVDVEREQLLRSALLSGELADYELEKQVVHRDGSLLPVRITTSPIPGEDGRPQFTVAVIESIEERRRLEEQIRQAQKMEAVGRLAGGVAHDFNNLLTVIQGYTELALRGLEPENRLRGGLEQVLDASQRAEQLTRQLLAFSRRQVVQPQALEVDEVVGSVLRLLRRLIGEDVELVARLRDDAGVIKADRGQLEQVLLNFAVNSRDAMPGGGVLTIEARQEELTDGDAVDRVLRAPPGRYGAISVSDTGTGIDSSSREHIFEPFFTTKAGVGTGLGLATVYGIVQQAGGDIRVESRPDAGTTFTVFFPLVGDEVAAAVTPAGADGIVCGHGHLLLVEDDDSVRELVERTLVDAGYRVATARTGADALDRLAKIEPIDLVITDVVLPGMSGRELAHEVAKRQPGVGVLYMSGYAEGVIAQRGVVDPDVHLIEKPFSASVITRKVSELVGRR